MKRLFIMVAVSAVGLVGTGCGNMVRYRTATHFAQPPGGKITYYATYMEGNCSGFGGCTGVNSKLRRCTINPDNSMACVDDAELNRVLNKDNQ